jgi:hypothetical protein
LEASKPNCVSKCTKGRIIGLLLLASIQILFPASSSANTHVSVRGTESGQGFIFQRLDECFLLTADHVVKSAKAATIAGGIERQRYGEARLLTRFAEQDVALLRVTGDLVRECVNSFSDYQISLTTSLQRAARGTMVSVFESTTGGLARDPIVVTDVGPEYIRVTPSQPGGSIFQGRSGSLVIVNERAAGMMIALEPGSTEQAKIVRLDLIAKLVADFFQSGRVAAQEQVLSQRNSSASTVGNLLTLRSGAAVVRWSSPSANASTSPHDLLLDSPQASWIASRKSREKPLEVDIRLSNQSVLTLSRVVLSAPLGGRQTSRMRDFEILTSLDGQSWGSVYSGTFALEDSDKQATFAPRRASFMRLRIYTNWDAAEEVSIGRILAFAQ